MKSEPVPTLRLHPALILLSVALIAFQLEQMQLLALVQWHHFAYLIISVALLGFGAAGTVVALYRPVLLPHLGWLLPVLLFICSIAMALALPLSRGMANRFDVCLLFVEPGQVGYLLFSQSIYLLVFFLGALPLGLVFIQFSNRINSLYCANLIGSGLGGILAVVLMNFIQPQYLPGVTALLPWIAGTLVIPRSGRLTLLAGAVLTLTVIVAELSNPHRIRPSQYKDISRTLDLPGSEIIASQPSPYGLIQLVTAPYLRYAPGLSLTYEREIAPVRGAVFSNGDWFGAVNSDAPAFLDSTMAALPYAMGSRSRVLVLESGTGMDILEALANGAEKVMAVEPHKKATAVGSALYSATDATKENPLYGPSVEHSFLSPRTWLARHQQTYDLITLPTIGSFGGASGLFALQEQYLLTVEGFFELWRHLSPDGVLRVATWFDSPSRKPLRLAATIGEVLQRAGADYRHHVAAVRGWNMITFVVKRTPLTQKEIEKIRSFCDRLQFDPALLPGLQQQERVRHHIPADPLFFDHLDALLSPSRRQELYTGYDFNLRPVSDDRPFFSQFLRWQRIPHLVKLFGERTVPFLELGYLIVLVSFVQMLAAAVILILLPLLRLGLPEFGGLMKWVVPFFSGLGLGYMFFEIMLIHELVLYFGHPIFGAAAGISSLLIFSGVGSLISGRWKYSGARDGLAAALAALLLFIYFFILPPFFQQTITRPLDVKIPFFLLVIAPPAMVMGMPFPLGLERLAGHSKSQAAWAWGINGCVSVVSAGLAAIVAVEFGFSTVMLVAGMAYGVAAAAAVIARRPTCQR